MNSEISGSIYEDDCYIFIKYSFNKPSPLNNLLIKSNSDDSEVKFICIDKTTSTLTKCASTTGHFVTKFYGIFGCIRFTNGPYLILITGRKSLGNMFKHPIYTIADVLVMPLFLDESNSDSEAKYMELFKIVDLKKDFYYSYTYALPDTVQNNYSVPVCDSDYGISTSNKFVYNQFHLDCLNSLSVDLMKLSVRVIHGYLSISPISQSGRIIELYIISRRSRHYAGTRYRKRGINAEGHVANEVQTEIVVYDSIHSGSIMSFVQLRGSIPLFWTQKLPVSILKKPPILYPSNDGTLSSTRRHFNYLFSQYGVPIICLNLLSDDLDNDEGQLSLRFNAAIQEINSELPQPFHIEYIHRDLRNYQIIGKSEAMMSETAAECIEKTGFFHVKNSQILSIQSGILRSSCLDCLDRTNTMIQRVSLMAVANMLYTINVLSMPDLTNDQMITDIIKSNISAMGDRLSMQYGGSRVLKKYESDQTVVNQSAQLLTVFQRRYTNSFGDADKQVSINLFLGILNPSIHPPPWEQDLDVILHTKYLPEFCGTDWFVLALQLFYNRFRTLSPHIEVSNSLGANSPVNAFPVSLGPSSSKASLLKAYSSNVNTNAKFPKKNFKDLEGEAPLDWQVFFSGDPQKCPFTTKITYIPWWILKLSTARASVSGIFISGDYDLEEYVYKFKNYKFGIGGRRGCKKHVNVELPALSKYIMESGFGVDGDCGTVDGSKNGNEVEKPDIYDEEYQKPHNNELVRYNVWNESTYESLYKSQIKFRFVCNYSGLYQLS